MLEHNVMDRLIDLILARRNPCIVGIDPRWEDLPRCYQLLSPVEGLTLWAQDVIDAVADIVPAIKPQMAFFEVFGPDGLLAHQRITRYAHEKGLLIIDDSKRGDIGSTAQAYARAHLSPDGPIHADMMTVSPFLGRDSLQPFTDAALRWDRGLFILVKTSNPSSGEISGAVTSQGETVRDFLAGYIRTAAENTCGRHGYSPIGAVVGATYPEEALHLRQLMPRSFFLVPGYGAQGGSAKDVLSCFNPDGLGAVISSSRGILFSHLQDAHFDHTRESCRQLVRARALAMQQDVYSALKAALPGMQY